MDKYRKVIKPKESVVSDEAEIRVTAVGSVSAYVTRAAKVFNELEKPTLTITGTGNAITKAVTLAEVVKRRFKGLHQITSLGSTEIVDEYEPLEEGLDKVIETRSLSTIEIKLSKEELDTKDKGYQAPLPESEIKEFDAEELSKSRGRGRGKGTGKGKGKSTSKGKGKGKDKDKSKSPEKGKGKGKEKGKGKDKGKEKGKGKGKDEGKGKNKGKGKYDEPKGKGKSKSKSKGWDSYDKYDYYGNSRKGKGSSGKGWDNYGYGSQGWGQSYNSWGNDYKSYGSSNGWGNNRGYSSW